MSTILGENYILNADKIIEAAIEREEYKAHLRREMAEWRGVISGDDVPRNRARDLITNDQKEGE